MTPDQRKRVEDTSRRLRNGGMPTTADVIDDLLARADHAEAEVARLRAVLDDASSRLAPYLADPLVRSVHAAMRAALAEPLADERGEPWAEYNRER